MRNKKFLAFLGLLFAIILGVALSRFFVDSEAQGQPLASVSSVPGDFNWRTYLQNYEDLRRAGIDTEEKAKRHWVEFGKGEGRDYHVIRRVKPPEPVLMTSELPVPSAVAAPIKIAHLPVEILPVTSRPVSRASLDSTPFDPANFRERYDKLMEWAGVKTKDEAMEFSLAFWEKRRKIYFS